MKSKPSEHSWWNSVGLGAAFLMATSAIGPGFLTQTTVFTQQLLSSFGFIILISILLDIGAQINIWRILIVSEKKAQDVANIILPGLGFFLAFLIVIGGLAFNIGNIAGAGLGINVLFGIDTLYGAVISCIFALVIFWMKEAGRAMDVFTKVLGILMIILTMYVAVSSNPPIGEALHRTIIPEEISSTAILTIVGGTVGGYITFAGAHRLLDAGIKGVPALPQVTKSAVTGILITSVMRYVLFLAAFGVVATGITLNIANPPADVFKIAAGQIGYKFFGMVMWAAAITSVVGSAYTSVSFIRSFHPWFEKNYRVVISIFIIFSTIVFAVVGRPIKVLVTVGAINGIVLPLALSIILLAAYKRSLIGTYKHPLWMSFAGWIVVAFMLYLTYSILSETVFKP